MPGQAACSRLYLHKEECLDIRSPALGLGFDLIQVSRLGRAFVCLLQRFQVQ